MKTELKRWLVVLAGVLPILWAQTLLPTIWGVAFGIAAGGAWGYLGMGWAIKRWPLE